METFNRILKRCERNEVEAPSTSDIDHTGQSGSTMSTQPSYVSQLITKEEFLNESESRPDVEAVEDPANSSEEEKATISISEFTFIKLIGKGGFGKVMLAKREGTEDVYAIKALEKAAIVQNPKLVEKSLCERRVLSLSERHPFVIALHCSFQSESHLYFVMDFIIGGDLQFQCAEYLFDVDTVKFYSAEVICALQFLHKHKVIYRDLKLENILVDWEGHCKLADFGLCKKGVTYSNLTKTKCGTKENMAPEMLKREEYGLCLDWWTLGVFMYRLLAYRPPFIADNDVDLMHAIIYDNVECPDGISEEAVDILQGLLQKNPEERLGYGMREGGENAIRRHPFFKDIDWGRLEARGVEPPFKPVIRGKEDTSNFDDEFTRQQPILTPTPLDVIKTIDQNLFVGFDFVDPDFLT